MLLSYPIFAAIFHVLSLFPIPGQGAFTVPVTSGNDTSRIEQNDAGTWCFYPAPRSERTILPEERCTGLKNDFSAVLNTHLNETASIGYYSAGLQRLGGPEFVVQAYEGKLYLCISGRASDGLYETSCEDSTRDNQFGVGPFGNHTVCQVEAAQETVTDGCYAPGLPEETPSNSASGGYVREGASSIAKGSSLSKSIHRSEPCFCPGIWLASAVVYTLGIFSCI